MNLITKTQEKHQNISMTPSEEASSPDLTNNTINTIENRNKNIDRCREIEEKGDLTVNR